MMSQLLKRNILKCSTRKFSSVVYPNYVTNAPLTEVSKTSNGVRVATEVIISLNSYLTH